VNRHLLVVMLALSLAVPAFAQQKIDPPQPAPGNVTLSLDEYNRLLALANRPGKRTEAPPLPYLLKHAELKLHVVNDDVLGSIEFEGETLSSNATKVPLISGATVLDARHGSKPLPLLLENGTHTAILPGESEFSVTLDAGLPISIETGRASFSLPVPSAGSVRLSLTVPGERANVQLNHGIITHRATESGNTQIEATLTPGQTANVWWNTREIVAPVVPREVRFLSDVKSLVSVTESDLQVAALVDLNVLQGEAGQFSAAIPEGFEVTAVNGPTLESSEVQNGVLLLKVTSHGPGAQQFLISFERPINDAKADAPILAFKDAQRETGEVLVEGQGTLELTAKESGGLKRLDIKEVNAYLRALSRYSLQAAFRYHRQPKENPALALEWTRFPDSSVLAAVAERATVTTLVTSEGKSLTEIKLIVRNQAQPFLKVDLPTGASILTAEVAGEKVKPVQGADGARVPLLRTGFRPAGAYTVSFVFMHSGAPFAKKGGSDISLPKMDVPISVLEWELYLPDQYKVKDFSGDAISASLLPPEYLGYMYGGGGFQAGVGVGATSGAGFVNPVTNKLSADGRDFSQLMALAPGVALVPGQIGGYVVDFTGAVIPNARVEIQNTATRNTWSAITTSDGYWLVLGLASGTYQIMASAQGFSSTSMAVPYDASNPSAYRISLNVGTTTQTVEVSAASTELTVMGKKKEKTVASPPPPPPQASANVFNLQQRVAGVLPVAVDVPRTGTSYRFVRPLVVNEETKLSFTYKTK
jgi:Carboxypeptidase regulatory-like domain